MKLSSIDWSLYAIIDTSFLKGRSLKQVAEDLIAGGAGILQLRNKTGDVRAFYHDALTVKEVAAQHHVPLIINDRADVAIATQADGVHVGQEDLPASVIRALLGRDKLVGVSVHSLREFEISAGCEPSYFGVGTIYQTATKSQRNAVGTEIITTLRRKTDKPIVAIGGIDVGNVTPVIQAGADGAAVISALMNAPDVKAKATAFMTSIRAARQKQANAYGTQESH